MTTQEAYRNRDFQVARNAKKDEFYTQLLLLPKYLKATLLPLLSPLPAAK